MWLVKPLSEALNLKKKIIVSKSVFQCFKSHFNSGLNTMWLSKTFFFVFLNIKANVFYISYNIFFFLLIGSPKQSTYLLLLWPAAPLHFRIH